MNIPTACRSNIKLKNRRQVTPSTRFTAQNHFIKINPFHIRRIHLLQHATTLCPQVPGIIQHFSIKHDEILKYIYAIGRMCDDKRCRRG